ncbi:hypothetical protein LINPERPRIM_LOCUS754 [Linum perenne]
MLGILFVLSLLTRVFARSREQRLGELWKACVWLGPEGSRSSAFRMTPKQLCCFFPSLIPTLTNTLALFLSSICCVTSSGRSYYNTFTLR